MFKGCWQSRVHAGYEGASRPEQLDRLRRETSFSNGLSTVFGMESVESDFWKKAICWSGFAQQGHQLQVSFCCAGALLSRDAARTWTGVGNEGCPRAFTVLRTSAPARPSRLFSHLLPSSLLLIYVKVTAKELRNSLLVEMWFSPGHYLALSKTNAWIEIIFRVSLQFLKSR